MAENYRRNRGDTKMDHHRKVAPARLVLLVLLLLALSAGLALGCGEDPRPVTGEGEITSTSTTLYGLTSVTEAAGDIYAVLSQEHQQMQKAVEALQPGDKAALEQATLTLKAHTDAEELVFYRGLESKGAMADYIAQAIADHDELGALTGDLAAAGEDEQAFDEALQALVTKSREHMLLEEGEIFAEAKTVLSEDEARQMVDSFEGQKRTILGTPPTSGGPQTTGPGLSVTTTS